MVTEKPQDFYFELSAWGRGRRAKRDGPNDSILFLACFFTAALARERFFYTLLLAGLKVKGVTFHFLDNVFLLYLSLETAKSVFEGFTLLQSDFSQTDYTPLLALNGPLSYGKHGPPKSSGL